MCFFIVFGQIFHLQITKQLQSSCVFFYEHIQYCKCPLTFGYNLSVVFILLSGMCLNFSGNGIKRGILLNLAGFAVTCVTVIAEPNQAVWFGVLNLIGCSMMIVSVLSDNLKKISPLSGALISLLLYAVSYDLQKGCVGFFGLDIVKLPDFLYSCKYLAFLGFPSSDFF